MSAVPAEGKELRRESLGVLINGKNIYETTIMSVHDASDFFNKLNLTETEQKISSQIMKEINSRLSFMKSGWDLNILTLERKASYTFRWRSAEDKACHTNRFILSRCSLYS